MSGVVIRNSKVLDEEEKGFWKFAFRYKKTDDGKQQFEFYIGFFWIILPFFLWWIF